MPFLVELSSQYNKHIPYTLPCRLKVNGRSACMSFAKMAGTGFRISVDELRPLLC
jgi:hypothetical protein